MSNRLSDDRDLEHTTNTVGVLKNGQTGPLLTVQEVAELLKVPVSWIYERTRKSGLDRVPGFRLGKYWRFREADVLAWLDRQRTGATRNA